MEDDYPWSLSELKQRFSTEEACHAYLSQIRWPKGFICRRCGEKKHWKDSRGRIICANCQLQTTVTAGTIFQDTRKPLVLWFRAIWWITSQKNGTSALGIQRVLGFGSYETAWTWLHKLRRAMVRPGRDRLTGRVEVDESFIGGTEEGVYGRQTHRKALVAIAAQENGQGIGRIRMRRIPDATAETLHAFVMDSVEPGSVVRTDDWRGYLGLEEKGYVREIVHLRGNRKKATTMLPLVHRVISLTKRWLLGTHQGAVSTEHIDYYLDEFTFRFNRRTSKSRGKLFYRLLQQAVVVDPAPYDSLVKQVRGLKRGSRALIQQL